MKHAARPYTYLIGWSAEKMFYYGVRYSKRSKPEDLFVSYFTSSAHVHETVARLGNPDIIQIRKKFTDSDSARKWEHKVLRRLKAAQRNDFINRTDNLFPIFETNSLNGNNRTRKQKAASNEHSKKMQNRISKKRKPITILGEEFSSITSALQKLQISYSLLTFIRNNDVSSFKTIDEIRKFVWEERSKKLQRSPSEETRKKISQSSIGKAGTRNGVTVGEETRKKISSKLIGQKRMIVKCPYCNCPGGVNTMKRWHFENCKMKMK